MTAKSSSLSRQPQVISDVRFALARSNFPRAADLALQALRAGVVHPLLLNVRAQWLENQGRDAEAVADLEAAVAMTPDDAALQDALGSVLLRLGRARRARDTFDRLAKAAPRNADAQFRLGTAYEALGDLDEAGRCFRLAETLRPGHAETLVHIAALAARRGDWSEGRQYADKVLAISPRMFDAVFVHATADIGTRDFDAAESRLAAIVADASAPDLVRATAHSLLADALDAQGRYDEAFAAYEAASALYLAGFSPRYGGANGAFAFVTRLREIFQTIDWATPDVAAPSGEPECATHVFAVGFPRSGTTLLERVLSAHPDVVSSEEREHLGEAAAMFLSDRSGVDRLNNLSGASLSTWRRAYWNSVRESGVDPCGRVFVDKLPLNTIKLPLIARLFPSAKIIFSLRDPRDVVLSCYRRRFGMTPSMFELLTLPSAVRFYNAVMELFEVYAAKLPLAPHFARYETLVDDFEGETRRLCDFLGLPWTHRLNDFSNISRRASSTPSAIQVKRGLYAGGAGQWRHYERHLAPVTPLLAPWIARWGYLER